MEATACLSFSLRAVREIKVRSAEHFLCGQTVFRVIRIDSADYTQFVLVVYFESKTEVASPSDGSYQYFSGIFLRRIIKSQLEERGNKHIGACTQLGIDYFLTEGKLSFSHIGLVCPVTGKLGQEILATVQVKHRRSILTKYDRLLLFVADFSECTDNILFVISYIMQLYGNRIFIIFKGNHRLVDSVAGVIARMIYVFQQQ